MIQTPSKNIFPTHVPMIVGNKRRRKERQTVQPTVKKIRTEPPMNAVELSIVEFLRQNRKVISNDKLCLCVQNTPRLKLFPKSVLDSISRENNSKGYWGASCVEMSPFLPLPHGTVFVDSDTTSSPLFVDRLTLPSSWKIQQVNESQTKKWSTTSCPSFMYSPQGCVVREDIDSTIKAIQKENRKVALKTMEKELEQCLRNKVENEEKCQNKNNGLPFENENVTKEWEFNHQTDQTIHKSYLMSCLKAELQAMENEEKYENDMLNFANMTTKQRKKARKPKRPKREKECSFDEFIKTKYLEWKKWEMNNVMKPVTRTFKYPIDKQVTKENRETLMSCLKDCNRTCNYALNFMTTFDPHLKRVLDKNSLRTPERSELTKRIDEFIQNTNKLQTKWNEDISPERKQDDEQNKIWKNNEKQLFYGDIFGVNQNIEAIGLPHKNVVPAHIRRNAVMRLVSNVTTNVTNLTKNEKQRRKNDEERQEIYQAKIANKSNTKKSKKLTQRRKVMQRKRIREAKKATRQIKKFRFKLRFLNTHNPQNGVLEIDRDDYTLKPTTEKGDKITHTIKIFPKKLKTIFNVSLPEKLQGKRMNQVTVQLDRNKFYLCFSYRDFIDVKKSSCVEVPDTCKGKPLTFEQYMEQQPSEFGDDKRKIYQAFLRFKKEVGNNNNSVGLDPGIRKFLTWFSSNGEAGFIGKDFYQQIKDLVTTKEYCARNMRKCKFKRKRQLKKWAEEKKNLTEITPEEQLKRVEEKRKWKQENRYRLLKFSRRYRQATERIGNITKDAHYKTCVFLLAHFDHIYLPYFNVSQMVRKKPKKGQKQLSTITRKAMLCLGHYTFRQRLIAKSTEFPNCTIHCGSEAYTSKTCTYCGTQNDVGSSETFFCKKCHLFCDRDLNASRGILLRACRPLKSNFTDDDEKNMDA